MRESSEGELADYLRGMWGMGQAPEEAEPAKEIFIGFTRPQGADNSQVLEKLTELLEIHKYKRVDIKLASLIEQAAVLLQPFVDPKIGPRREHDSAGEPGEHSRAAGESRGFGRVTALMQWGDFLRRSFEPYTAAVLGVLAIRFKRESLKGSGFEGVAYFISNLVHPEEVQLLRSVYRERFFLVATHQPEEERVEELDKRFSKVGDSQSHEHAKLVVRIDEGKATSELPEAFGFYVEGPKTALNVSDTFHRADIFVGARREQHEAVLERWIAQLFGYPFGTPSADEMGMSVAYVASYKSSAFGRSVGAAVVDGHGAVIGMGWNDNPQPGGGVSTSESVPNLQDHVLTPPVDPSDSLRLDTVWEMLQRLFGKEWSDFYNEAGWPADEDVTASQRSLRQWLEGVRNASREQLDAEMVGAMPVLRPLTSTRAFNLIEFGRAVHAEMHVIGDAARRGVRLQDATLYVTTFPCHECARNILAAGIRRVVFVEPYGKSLVSELYEDSISNRTIKSSADDYRVPFEPFVGLSPSRESEFFSRVSRKTGLREAARKGSRSLEGRKVAWNPTGHDLRPIFQGSAGLFAQHFERARLLAEEELIGQFMESVEILMPDFKATLQQ